jgi:cell division septation protein DedD
MDRALKQRLVGASVLIALAVIVLPMLLGGRPEPGQQTSEQIELPARPDGVEFETRRFPLGEEPAVPPARDSASEPLGAVDDDAESTRPAAEVAGPAEQPASMTESAAAAAQEDVEEEPTAGTIDQEQGLPPVTAVEIPVSEKVDLPVEDKQSETRPTAAKPAASTGRYAVQVASLGSEANARKLQSQLEAKGYAVIRDRIESDVGQLNRIRVGPYASETEATAAARKIQGQIDGVTPRTVDLDPGAAQTLNPSDPLVRWVVQLGSFGESSNAENLVKQVRAQGLSAYSERVTSSSGSVINRVRVGPFLQREDASSAQSKLNSSLGINGVVMSAD